MTFLSRLFRPLIEAEVEERIRVRDKEEERLYIKSQEKAKTPLKKPFKSGGIQYYECKDLFSLNSQRALAGISFYEELRMKCTREFLIEHIKAHNEILGGIKEGLTIKDNKLNLEAAFDHVKEAERLNMQISERLEMIFEPDCVMKLASIVFFDDTEDPLGYDMAYGIEKVNKWKKQGVNAFFLSKHMKDLMPSLNISEEDFQQYTEVAEKMTTEHLANISTILSKSK